MATFAKSQPERTDFAESHGGKYRYRRRGLLDGVPYRKLARGVIVLRVEDLDIVVDFLREYTSDIHVRRVELSSDDLEVLQTDTLP